MQEDVHKIVSSDVYKAWAVKHPIDATKIEYELRGLKRPRAGSLFAQGLQSLIREVTPPAEYPSSPMAFWQSQGAFQSWGLTNGQFTPDTLFALGKQLGLEWIAVQDRAENRTRRAEIVTAAKRNDIKVAVWEWATTLKASEEALAFWSPDAYILNVEHFDYDPALPSHLRTDHPNLPLGVVTNFSGVGATKTGTYDKTQASPWIANKWACLPEAYMVNEQGAQPTLSPDHMQFTAVTQLGWPEGWVFPVFGLYRTRPEFRYMWESVWPTRKPGMAFYAEEVKTYPYHSWYLMETL